MCQKCAMNFPKRDKPGSMLLIVTVLLPYVLVCSLQEYFLKFDTGWLRFEVSGFWFRNSRSLLGRALQLTRTELVCKMENELSQLYAGDLASWSPFLKRMLGRLSEEVWGSVMKSFSEVNSSLSEGNHSRGRALETFLPLWSFVFESWIWFSVYSLPDSIINNTCKFMRSVAVWNGSLPEYPDLVLNNPKSISALSSTGSISQPSTLNHSQLDDISGFWLPCLSLL